jgi:hypothetical protein
MRAEEADRAAARACHTFCAGFRLLLISNGVCGKTVRSSFEVVYMYVLGVSSTHVQRLFVCAMGHGIFYHHLYLFFLSPIVHPQQCNLLLWNRPTDRWPYKLAGLPLMGHTPSCNAKRLSRL